MAENEDIKNETVEETAENIEVTETGTAEETAENIEVTETGTAKETAEQAENTEEAAPAAEKPAKKKFNSKKLKHGSLSVVFTIMFIAAVVLVNVILNLVLDRFSLEVDLTTGAMFSLGDETKDFIAGVDDDVKFYVTAERETLENAGTFYKQVVEFLEKMASINNRFEVKYVNLLTDPDFSSQYTETLKNYQIVVQSGTTGRYRILSINDFIKYTLSDGNDYTYEQVSMYSSMGMDMSQYITKTASFAEEQLVSAIMSVSKQNPTIVRFVTGYGESDSSALEKILTDNAYVTETVEIERVDAIPEDTDILVMYGPTKDYSLDSITKVDEWLSNGGKYGKNLVYLATPDVAETPNLDEYLKEWGLSVGRGYVIQGDKNYARSYMGMSGVLQDLDMPNDTEYYNNMKKASGASLIGFYMRPVQQLWSEEGNMKNTALVKSYGENCILYPFDADENWDPNSAETSGYDIVVEASKVQFEGGIDPVYSKVIVVGSDLLFSETFTTASNYSNGELALTLFDTNSDNVVETVKVVEKTFTAENYEITANQQLWIGLVFAVFIPVIVIVIGIIVWAKRRRL